MQIEKINGAAEVMNEIILHVRDYVSLEEGKKRLSIENVKIQCLIDEIHLVFDDRLKHKELELIVNDNHLGEKEVKGNRVAISNSVINNIISNAIKFSERKGKIYFDITQRDLGHITFSIRDEGVGMPEHKLSELFTMTCSTSTRGTEGERGTGYGMPMVKQTIDNLNGEIYVRSSTEKEKRGTEVTFILELI